MSHYGRLVQSFVTPFLSVVSSLQLDVLKRKVDTYALAATFICLVQVTAHTQACCYSSCVYECHLTLSLCAVYGNRCSW
jgi:hypothetical protein